MKYIALVAALLIGLDAHAANTNSSGINSNRTRLDGSGVWIGQVEGGRSGKPGHDDPEFSASITIPEQVSDYLGAPSNSPGISFHATLVAGVMIGKDNHATLGDFYEGVAPNARLFSKSKGFGDDGFEISLNSVATSNQGEVRAINLSTFGLYEEFTGFDGNSHSTKFVDWSARVHDVLYVSAWMNTDSPIHSPPTDNYNGITVASSADDLSDPNRAHNHYYRWAAGNAAVADAKAPGTQKSAIDLLAPGEYIRMLNHGDNDAPVALRNGASFAAPHVTGAVALLHQYYQQQIDASNPRFDFRRRTHHVMKAVLLNSADKINGVQDTYRTIKDSQMKDWFQSEAYLDPTTPLDDEMGAGHLNVDKAVAQLAAGEYNPGEIVPSLGWDWNRSEGSGEQFEYLLGDLSPGWFTSTLAWDRNVQLTDPDDSYSAGDQFFNQPFQQTIADLDLYLLLVTDQGEFVEASSVSSTETVEHIFHNIQVAGEYKLVVRHEVGQLDARTDYGLAWWHGDAGLNPPIPGDYDEDGEVDPQDYNEWEDDFGSNKQPGFGADGNGDGLVDAADYTVWRDAYAAASATAAVPEPTTAAMLAVGLVSLRDRRQAT